jgi:Asp/Glu/hydantoin racemase
MPDRILVINPNSTDAVTRAIDDAMVPLRIPGGLTLGHRFGVISILARSVPRHLRYIAAMGVGQRLAGDLPIGLGVTELADGRTTLARMIDVGRRLRDQHGADVLVMGCAGMARYRADLKEAVRIPVVEPTQAAVAMAIGRIRLGWGQSSR